MNGFYMDRCISFIKLEEKRKAEELARQERSRKFREQQKEKEKC